MALLGQASGGFTESNSALRILHVGVRNTVTQLSADAFTQTNPPTQATHVTTASGFSSQIFGVLSGSVAFTRPDADTATANGVIGGPKAGDAEDHLQRPVGIFINTANGQAFTNQPGIASNRGPYVSAQGTYANKLYETKILTGGGDGAAGTTITYVIGSELAASINGYLTSHVNTGADDLHDIAAGSGPAGAGYWTLGILTIAPDSASDELVYDQRI